MAKVIGLRAPVLKLVAPRPDADTVEVLRSMLAEAMSGKIVGIAYVALERGGEWTADATGDAMSRPVFSLGALDVLCNLLRERIKS